MKEFKSISAGRSKEKLFDLRLAYLNTHAPRVGQGMARIVFNIGNDTILKLSKSNLGQNSHEVTVTKCAVANGYSNIIVPVLKHAPDFTWLTMEKVTGFNRDADHERFFRMFSKMCELPDALYVKDFSRMTEVIRYIRDYETGDPASDVPRLRALVARPLSEFLLELVALVRTCRVAWSDLEVPNWGLSGGKLVLLDYGFQ